MLFFYIKIFITFIFSFILYPYFINCLYSKDYIFNTNDIFFTYLIILLFYINTIIIIKNYFLIQSEHSQLKLLKTIKPITKNKLVEVINNKLKNSYIKINLQELIVLSNNTKLTQDNYRVTNHLTNKFQSLSNYVQYSISTLIFIGLLGTFMGLVTSVNSLEDIFITNALTNDSNELLELLSASFGGIHLAFGTSICGLLSSLFIGLLFYLFRETRTALILDTNILLNSLVLPTLFQSDFDIFAQTFTKNLNKVIAQTIIKNTTTLNTSVENLNGSIHDLNKFVCNIKEVQDSHTTIINSFKESSDSLKQSTSTLEKHSENFLIIEKKHIENNEKLINILDDNNSTINKVDSNIQQLVDNNNLFIDKLAKEINGFQDKHLIQISNFQDKHFTQINELNENTNLLSKKLSVAIGGLSNSIGRFNKTLNINQDLLLQEIDLVKNIKLFLTNISKLKHVENESPINTTKKKKSKILSFFKRIRN